MKKKLICNFFCKKIRFSHPFSSFTKEQQAKILNNFNEFLLKTTIFKTIDFKKITTDQQISHIFQQKLQTKEILPFIQQLSCQIDNFQEPKDILSILSILKLIKLQTKSTTFTFRSIISSYKQEILRKLNENFIKELQTREFHQYMNYDEPPNFYTTYLQELSKVDRLEFIKLIRKIDPEIELHNTNLMNRYTVNEFEKNFHLAKKRFIRYLPYVLIFGWLGNLAYLIWALYYCFEYDVWMFDPRVTDYHVYRFS